MNRLCIHMINDGYVGSGLDKFICLYTSIMCQIINKLLQYKFVYKLLYT